MSLRSLCWALLPALLTFGACACDDDPLAPAKNDPNGSGVDAGELAPDATAAEPDASVMPDAGPTDTGVPPEPEARTLRFDGTSPVVLYFGATRDLRFVLTTVSGAPVPGERVRFTLAGAAGALTAQVATTDASGVAVVGYRAGASGGTDSLTAEADRAPSVTVSLEVHEDPAATLRLDVSSQARIAVARADAQVYVGATVPSCAQLGMGAAPASTHQASFAALPASQLYMGEASGAQVTAVAVGLDARGGVVARGCAEGLRLVGATTNVIAVVLAQLPSDPTGAYDALLYVDVGAALPPPYGPVVVTVTDILSDPAGWAVFQTLAALDQQIGSTFVTWTPPGGTVARLATFDEVRANAMVFNTWRIATTALDSFLEMQLGQPYTDVTNVGADIAHALRAFEVGAGFAVTSTGAPARLRVEEEWKALVFQWQLGCPSGDLGCARRAITLSGANAALAPARATYGATWTHAPSASETERFQLQLDPHAINLRYGAVILLVLNQVVFPNLPASVAGNNLTQVLGNVVRCADVALAIANATGLPPTLFQNLCTTAVSAAAASVEARLLALDSANNPSLVAGAGGGTLFLEDRDHDLATEALPELTTFAAWSSGGSSPITAPIVGHGRKAASGCRSDADCAGRACAPIASYLEVRQVEHDCRRPAGAAMGGVGCAMDADCASDLCFDPGTGVRICYAACEGGAACALGTCRADVAHVDLNGALAGLGDAAVDACVP